MLRSAASKVLWVGRATVFTLGLAVVLALLFGVATMALAGTGVGDTFNLGRLNQVGQISQLVGFTNDPMLRIANKGGGASATALDLRVEPSQPPMTVGSSAKVANLNADKLDGLSSAAFEPSSNVIAYGPFRQLPQGTGGTPIKVLDVGYLQVYVACDTDGVPGRTRTHVFVPQSRTPFAMTRVSSAGDTTLVESAPGDNAVTLMQTEDDGKMVTTSGAILTKGGEDKEVTFNLYQHRNGGVCTFGGHVMKGN